MGIEPTSLAWKAKVLPLNYTRFLAGAYFRKLGLKADTSYPARALAQGCQPLPELALASLSSGL